MKIIVAIVVILSFAVYAKKDDPINMKEFSSELNSSIHDKVEQNPQEYETKDIMRKPASVSPVEPVVDEEYKNLDKFEPQNIGHGKL